MSQVMLINPIWFNDPIFINWLHCQQTCVEDLFQMFHMIERTNSAFIRECGGTIFQR